VTSTSGGVQVVVQGETVALGPGAPLGRGAELTTAGDGQVVGACRNGSGLAVGPQSSVFFGDSLCEQSDSGALDITRGQLSLTGLQPGISGTAAGTRVTSGVGPMVQTPVSQAVAKGAGASFSTTYSQAGKIGTAVVAVTAGAVDVTDPATGALTTISGGHQITVSGPVTDVVSAVLPSSRSVQVGGTATAFATMINVGAGGAITATADTGAASLPIAFGLCQTDPATGACRGPVGPTATAQVDAGATPTFAMFATAGGPISFDPAGHRIFVRFRDAGGVIRGATSVAVRTQ